MATVVLGSLENIYICGISLLQAIYGLVLVVVRNHYKNADSLTRHSTLKAAVVRGGRGL